MRRIGAEVATYSQDRITSGEKRLQMAAGGHRLQRQLFYGREKNSGMTKSYSKGDHWFRHSKPILPTPQSTTLA